MTVTAMLHRQKEDDDDDVYYYIRWRLKLEGETENMGVCTKERKGVTAELRSAWAFLPFSVPAVCPRL